MSASQADWRADMEASRDLSDQEKQHFGFLLGWFESWRLKQGLAPGRAAAVAFWRAQVISKPRKEWQLDKWSEAMRWHARWLELARARGMETRSLPERVPVFAALRRGKLEVAF